MIVANSGAPLLQEWYQTWWHTFVLEQEKKSTLIVGISTQRTTYQPLAKRRQSDAPAQGEWNCRGGGGWITRGEQGT